MYTVNVEQEQQTQVLALSSPDTSTIKEIYESLVRSENLPQMEIVTVSNGECAGLFWDKTLNDTEYYIPYGRFFNAEEMRSGGNVTLLGTHFLCNLPLDEVETIWETGISINGIHFDAVGNYLFSYPTELWDELYSVLVFPVPITIPLKTYFDIGITASKLRCVFTSSLTKEQVVYLRELLNNYGDISISSIPSLRNENAMSNFAAGITPYALIFLLGFLNISSIITYWLQVEFPRYKVYLICGAKQAHISFFISFSVIMLITVSYAMAFLIMIKITQITPNGIITSLPWQFHGITYCTVILITVLIVNMRAIPIVLGGKIL